MDIAEIRKKARGGKPAQAEPGEFVQNRPVEASQAESSVSPGLSSERPVPRGAITAAVPVLDPLEKLFSVHENLGLATEEMYLQTLTAEQKQAAQEVEQYLAFQLGQEEYALDIKQISEIIKVRELTEIPRVPGFVLGIISLRGVVVPVFDLSQRLQLGPARLTASSRIVVSRIDETVVGLLVDSINQVITLSGGRLEPPPSILTGVDREMITGVGRFQGRLVIVLNLPGVMNIETS